VAVNNLDGLFAKIFHDKIFSRDLNTSKDAVMKSTEEKLQVLSSIAKRFNAVKITWAIGASAMLYFNKIVDEFRDLDIVIDEKDALAAKDILLTMGTMKRSNPGEHYKTKHFYEFVVDDVDVDIMGGFVIEKDGIEYDCSLNIADIVETATVCGQIVPLHSMQAWRRYYKLMGRSSKVTIIDRAISIAEP
jgi:hypothetical protein